MNILDKKILAISGILIIVSFYTLTNNRSSITKLLNDEKHLTEKLQKTISSLSQKNSELKEELNISKQQIIFSGYDKTLKSNIKTSLTAVESNPEVLIKTDSEKIIKITGKESVPDDFDINKPFNGIDPASKEQQEKYAGFKNDIDNYEFNERFNMQGFLSDPRFTELHASLGVKLLDYVDKKLDGIVLMQDSVEGAKMLIEIDD